MSTLSLPRLWNTNLSPCRRVLALWLILGAAISVRTLLKPTSHTVFPVFATGAIHWWSDVSLYDDHEPLDYFRYPPAFAIVLTPFAWLGMTLGGIAWSWLSLGVYAWGLWAFLRATVSDRWSAEREALFMALALLGGLRGFWNAQANGLAVGFLLLGAAHMIEQRWWRAATFLALPVMIKLTPLAPVLLLCTLRPRQLAGRLGLIILVGLLIPFLTRPPDIVVGQYQAWGVHLVEKSSQRWAGFRDAWTLWSVLEHYATGRTGPVPLEEPIGPLGVYRSFQLLTALAAFMWCVRLSRRGLPLTRLVPLTTAMGVTWLMLLGPAVEHATFVFLAPLVVWGMLHEDTFNRARWAIGLAFAFIFILGWGAFARPLQSHIPLVLAILPLGALLFLAWLLLNQHQER